VAHKITVSQNSNERTFTPREGATVYAQLRKQVVEKGLLKRSYGYYFLFTLFTYAGLIGSFIGAYYSGNIFLFVFMAVLYAFFSVQVGGLVHDAGHRSIFKSAKNNNIVGHFFATTVGFAFNNWRINHDRHHANPNQDDFDPDVDIPFSFTKERMKNSKGLARLICKYQAWVYYPLGTLTSFSVRFKRMNYFSENWGPKVYPEVVLFAFGVIMHVVLPFLAFGIVKGLAFFVLTNLLSGFYLFNIFAPNHKGMPELAADTNFSFLEQQIVTSRNIVPSIFTDYFYMGLNYQIEHHLFPATPRNKMRYIAPLVKEICKKHRLEYTQTSVIESNVIIFNEMRAMSKAFVV